MSLEISSIVVNSLYKLSTMKFRFFLLFISVTIVFVACKQSEQTANGLVSESMEYMPVKISKTLPEWAKNANVYEVNIRQYTKEGTINAFAEHLPRLKKMGVDILCLMPVFPISKTKRKGKLGSYYAVSDFKKVNPNFGTKKDLQALVKKIHALDMKVVLDWIPNHTGWDHSWIKEHPEYYVHDTKADTIVHGRDFNNKITDWYDVAELDYNNKEMRELMIDEMSYWIAREDIDGYRLGCAHSVASDFWNEATASLYKIKPIFLIPETNDPSFRNSGNFDLTYGLEWHNLMNDIAKGKRKASDLDKLFAEYASKYRRGFTMQFTSNHDENSNNGSEIERMADGHKAFAVLAATFDGIPLIYSGQEEPLIKRLEVFEKDEIKWGSFQNAEMYRKLFDLKHRNKALWNGEYGGLLKKINAGNENVYAFTRSRDGDKVIVIINLSDLPQTIKLDDETVEGAYSSIFSNSTVTLTAGMDMKLKPWEYIVLEGE